MSASDFCGIYETGAKECEDIDGTIGMFRKAIAANAGCIRRMMYGTDFCPPINLSQIEEYDYSIEKLFDKKDFDDIYFGSTPCALSHGLPNISSYKYLSIKDNK